MKTTNFVITNILNIFNKFGDKRLPQKISYAITKNIITINKEYQVYETQLKKLFEQYNEYIQKDEHGEPRLTQNGIPIVDKSVEKEFNDKVEELINFEIDVELYHIDADVFDYDDAVGKYDVLSANDTLILQSVLCEKE